jgi:hypothetical protein
LFVLFMTYATLGGIFGVLRLGKRPKKVKVTPQQEEESLGDLQEEDEDTFI